MVAQPLRRAEELETLWLCVAPLRLGGLRGKKSTPSVWLGGTGELLRSASRSSLEQEQLGVRSGGSKESLRKANKAMVWTFVLVE